METKIIIEKYNQGISSEQLAKDYDCNVKTVIKILKKNNIKIDNHKASYRKYIFNESFFNKIDSENKAYWLGFLFADGCVSKERGRLTLALAEIDKQHIEKFISDIDLKNKDIITYNNKTKSYRVVLNSNILKQDLVKLGCVPNKSYQELKIPILENLELYKHFIRGYFDGDGCLTFDASKNRYKINILGCGRITKFINHFFHILLDLTLTTEKIDKRFKSDITRCIEWGGKQNVLSILNFLYNDANIFLERKRDKYLQIDQSDIRNRRKTGLYKMDLPTGDYLIRSLTPIECERLQGFSDEYTNCVSKTQRLKALGNSFTVPVIEHILKAILYETK